MQRLSEICGAAEVSSLKSILKFVIIRECLMRHLFVELKGCKKKREIQL